MKQKIKRMINLLTKIRTIKKDLETIKKDLESLKKDVNDQNDLLQELLNNLNSSDLWVDENRNKYKGKRCFLVCGGPSVKDLDLKLLDSEYVMAVNGAIMLEGLSVDFFTTVSEHWYETYLNELENLDCKRIFIPRYLDDKIKFRSDAVSLLSTVKEKHFSRFGYSTPYDFSTDMSKYVALGGSVTTVGLQILYYLGFEEVIILGLDHNYDISKGDEAGLCYVNPVKLPHFIENYYRKDTKIALNVKAMEKGYCLANKVFNNAGRKIYNASKISKLETFDKIDWDRLFQGRD